jgi:hypothetical protein
VLSCRGPHGLVALLRPVSECELGRRSRTVYGQAQQRPRIHLLNIDSEKDLFGTLATEGQITIETCSMSSVMTPFGKAREYLQGASPKRIEMHKIQVGHWRTLRVAEDGHVLGGQERVSWSMMYRSICSIHITKDDVTKLYILLLTSMSGCMLFQQQPVN